ncbi:sensor histidine kinase, partial [Streptomyces sp. NPDC127574]
MQRLYDFLRRHPTWVDSFWAVALLGITGVNIVSVDGAADHHGSVAETLPIAFFLSVVVALRRRMPEKMLVLAAVMGFVQLVVDVEVMTADFAMLVIIYTVAADGARWASRFALAGGLCAGTLAQLRWPANESGALSGVLIAIFQTVPFALAWVLGDSIRTRRAYFAQLEERAARLEKEREAQAKVAVAAERARIAREL